MNALPQSLVHIPFGNEHPYEQEPIERTPRHPLAGQPVRLGVQAQPETAQVRVEWQVNGVPQTAITAQRLADRGGDERNAQYSGLWQAELPAQPDGANVVYSFVDDAGHETAQFEYKVVGWQDAPQLRLQWQQVKPGVWRGKLSDSAMGEVPLLLLRVEQLKGNHAETQRARLTFASPIDEAFYGFGERFNALDQRGQRVDVRCFEQYKTQYEGTRTYIPMPFFVSSRGYGLLVESLRYMAFDLAASAADTWTLEAETDENGTLEFVLYVNDDLLAITGMFCDYTGKPELPPDWAFGLWMSGNEWNSQARVVEEVNATLQHDIPATVLVIEAWSDEATFYIWNDAQYLPQMGAERFRYTDFTFPPDGKWTNPKAMIDWLHSLGIRIILWQVPAFKKADAPHAQHDADTAHFIESGYAVKDADGEPHRIRPFWFRGGMLWDVTNPDAREWWLGKRTYLLEDLHIDGFKTDGGEHLWGYDVQFADGRTGAELWNEYPLQYIKAYHEFAKQHNPDSLTFSRAGFTGAGRFPAHWAGDENSTWEAFRGSILAGLSAGISGVPFWGWDIGGFSGDIPSAELYLRAAAMAAFCPIMQYHAEYNAHQLPRRDRTPWNIAERTGDERVLPVFRKFVKLREQLMPYILKEAAHSAETGLPMMRALPLVYANDADCRAFPYQYLFGRDLLVVPVTEPGAETWRVYLPVGEWTDYWTGDRIEGGQVITRGVALDVIPVYARAAFTQTAHM